MPTSQFHQISKIIELALAVKPVNILDVGVGFGKYGVLLREYLEYWFNHESYDNWKINIEGIEIFEQYLTPLHKYIYNKIHCSNALNVLPTLNSKYDLILMIDVLEHFTYEEGVSLLNSAIKKSKNVLVSVPKDIGEQSTVFGNKNETHEFQWKKSLLKKYDPFYIHDNESLIFCISDDKEKVKKLYYQSKRWYFKQHLQYNLKHYLPFIYKIFCK